MEILAVLIMIMAGGAIAIFALIALAVSRNDRDMVRHAASNRDVVAASILYHLLISGGTRADAASREVRRQTGIAGRVTEGIDMASWADSYVRMSSPEQRAQLLETAVRLVASRSGPVPLAQYTALLDLSFGLGFQTDALARLRERYGFDYVDHAKNARPREADRTGGATTFFSREQGDPMEWLRVLEIEGPADRQMIIAAYRRLAARHHPDKVRDRSAEAQDLAAARFIEITRAYEHLMAMDRD